MHRFYIPDRLGVGIKAEIKGPEARHVKDVLRLKVGAHVILFDGSGKEFNGEIAGFGKGLVSVDISEAREGHTESPAEIILGQGIPKSDKMDLIVQKSTELGVTKIVPLYTERVVPRSFSPQKLERWKRIAIEACKQSGRVKVPCISEPVAISDFVASSEPASLKLISWEGEEVNSLKNSLPSHLANNKVEFVVGPEGGLTEKEIEIAKKNDFLPISLGKRILRTETVSLTLVSIVQYLYGDLS